MKNVLGFLLLVGCALLLLTVITGIAQIFTSIATTWTENQTAQVASGLSQVLWLGGIVFVMVLGFGLYTNFSKGSKGWGNNKQAPNQEQYQVLNNLPHQSVSNGLLDHEPDDGEWYAFEETNGSTANPRAYERYFSK